MMTFEKAELLIEQLLDGSKDWLLIVSDSGRPIVTDHVSGKKVSKIRRKKCPLRRRSNKRCRQSCPICKGVK